MNVKVIFSLLDSKELMFDSSLIEIQTNCIYIKDVDINTFTRDELNKLANSFGVDMSQLSNGSNKIRLYVGKESCKVDFMPLEEDRVKYLTDRIDKMSTELNSIINK